MQTFKKHILFTQYSIITVFSMKCIISWMVHNRSFEAGWGRPNCSSDSITGHWSHPIRQFTSHCAWGYASPAGPRPAGDTGLGHYTGGSRPLWALVRLTVGGGVWGLRLKRSCFSPDSPDGRQNGLVAMSSGLGLAAWCVCQCHH